MALRNVLTVRIVTAEEMKQLDRQTIEDHGIPSLVLMERAALASVDVLHEQGFDLTEVVVICGPGNNGGDGLCVARLLHLAGFGVTVGLIGDALARSTETRQELEIATSYGVPILDLADCPSQPTTVIDALLGIGGQRAPAGQFLDAVRYINGATAARVLAVDIPSGVSANTGETPGEAVQADTTVTFAYTKVGLTRDPGKTLAGQVIVKDIGIY